MSKQIPVIKARGRGAVVSVKGTGLNVHGQPLAPGLISYKARKK